MHTHQSWKQKWHVTIVIPRMHCNVKPGVSFLGGLVHITTCYTTLKNAFKNVANAKGIHSITFHPKLRIVRFTLISFMGFPAILSTLRPFQICIFNRTKSKLMFEIPLRYWRKGSWQICNHHWTVHIKSEFQHLAGGGLYWHNMHKYKLFLLVLLPRILMCINIKLFLPVLLPRNILNYSQNWYQCTLIKAEGKKWHVTIVIPRIHCNVAPNVSFCWGSIQQLLILNSEMNLNFF